MTKIILTVWLASLLTAPAAGSYAATPTAQIRSTVDQVTTLLTDPKLRTEGKRAERQHLLQDLIRARFDFQEMAKRSLGVQWRRLTTDQQGEFVILFRDLLEKAYLGRIESYGHEKFLYTQETVDGPYAEVRSDIQTDKNGKIAIHYRLLRAGEQWRIYDVVIEDISLVNNYRSQFGRILSRSSYDELVHRMKSKLIDKPEGRP